MNKETKLLASALSVVFHLLEYNETGRVIDLVAAKGILQMNNDLFEWAKENAILLPTRQSDGATFAEILAEM